MLRPGNRICLRVARDRARVFRTRRPVAKRLARFVAVGCLALGRNRFIRRHARGAALAIAPGFAFGVIPVSRRNKMIRRVVGISALLVLSLSAVRADNWPQWRGPNLNGTSNEKNLPVKWTTEENVVWKLALPSWSGSTPI